MNKNDVNFIDATARIIEKTLKETFAKIKFFLFKLRQLRRLRKKDFKVVFHNEGQVIVEMPHLTLLESLFQRASILSKEIQFSLRPNQEALLRKIVYDLFKSGYLDNKKSVVDIGCWIGDNTLVWAQMLDKNAVVHAIDPSINNISFGKELAQVNKISNINWVLGVCAESSGGYLVADGSIDHTAFSFSTTPSSGSLLSTTIDEIVAGSDHKDISMIHVDVEGLEENVMRGAESVILKCRPVILYEQHISQDKVRNIIDLLTSWDYRIFMINEVLPGCRLDCRNFIAFDARLPSPKIPSIEQSMGHEEGVWYASVGQSLIPIS
jgi:FkbM family methyltransferase